MKLYGLAVLVSLLLMVALAWEDSRPRTEPATAPDIDTMIYSAQPHIPIGDQ